MSRDLCLFAHFDRDNRVDPYVIHYLEALVRCGFDVVFVTASKPGDDDLRCVRRVCRDVIVRENCGLDFGSWAEAYRRFGRDHDGSLLLANDSVYGPIGELAPALDRLRSLPGDVHGLVESLQHSRHLQSWFVLLSRSAHRSDAFQKLMDQDFASMTKREVIENGELALSVKLRTAGFDTSALFSLSHRQKSFLLNYNPTHLLWRYLIERTGIPFIKVELLRDNPSMVSDIDKWQEVVHARSPRLLPIIRSHLHRASSTKKKNRHYIGHFYHSLHQSFAIRDLFYDSSNRHWARKAHGFLFLIIRKTLGLGGRTLSLALALWYYWRRRRALIKFTRQ